MEERAMIFSFLFQKIKTPKHIFTIDSICNGTFVIWFHIPEVIIAKIDFIKVEMI